MSVHLAVTAADPTMVAAAAKIAGDPVQPAMAAGSRGSVVQ